MITINPVNVNKISLWSKLLAQKNGELCHNNSPAKRTAVIQ